MTATPPARPLPAWVRTAFNIGWRVAVGIALLAFILSRLNPAKVGAALRHMAPLNALGAVVLMLLVGIITAAKWQVLLRGLAIRVPFVEVARLTYIAVTYNLVLPGGETGNVVKAALLARTRPTAAGGVWASMLVDQVSLSVAQVLVGAVTLLLAQLPPPHVAVWLAACGFIFVGTLLFYALFLMPWRTAQVDAAVTRLSRALAVPAWLRREERLAESPAQASLNRGEWLAPLWRGLIQYRGHIAALATAIGVAAAYYATIFLAYWLAARGLGIGFGYADVAWIMALAGIAALLPITPAGVGVRDGIIVYFLGQRGVANEAALAFSLSVLALQVVLGTPGIVLQFLGSRAVPPRMAST
jgi:uncharacterized protein (TIRG00374 family)